ncbi:MAG: rRNA maturation RNase YbeY [Candidatus Hydrothermales bacterium]
MFNLNFFKTVKKKIPISKNEIKRLKRIFKKEIKSKNLKIKEINVVMVGKDRIKSLNKNFLNKNKKTDCLSFNLEEVGEIYICSCYIKNKTDFLKLLTHSFCHILGYDHKSKNEKKFMEEKEKSIIKKIKL